jgi:hypothetical protein
LFNVILRSSSSSSSSSSHALSQPFRSCTFSSEISVTFFFWNTSNTRMMRPFWQWELFSMVVKQSERVTDKHPYIQRTLYFILVTTTAVYTFLGWYYATAIHVFRFTVLSSSVSCFGVWQF